MAWASKQTAGGGTNKLVLLMIADATSHDNPILVIKMERMVRLCELHERTIRNAIRDLEANGLIGTVERFFEGQQIANGYFLMAEEWVEQAKDRIRAESHRDGYTCRLREIPEHCSVDSRTVFGGRPVPDTALGRVEIPGGEGGDTGQLLPSSFLPSSSEPISSAAKQPAAPEPAAPEKVKTRSQSSTVREQELAQRLLDIWNSACDRAKLTRRSLPRCLKFPVDAIPAMKKYMKAYTDDEIIQLVTDGSRSVQKNDFYHERRYGFVNLMRNLGANANLSAPAERCADAPDGASPIPVAPSPKSAGLFDFDQDEAAAERQKLLDYEASLPLPEFPC